MKREKEKETQRDKKKLKEWEELVTYYRREYEKTVYPKVGKMGSSFRLFSRRSEKRDGYVQSGVAR